MIGYPLLSELRHQRQDFASEQDERRKASLREGTRSFRAQSWPEDPAVPDSTRSAPSLRYAGSTGCRLFRHPAPPRPWQWPRARHEDCAVACRAAVTSSDSVPNADKAFRAGATATGCHRPRQAPGEISGGVSAHVALRRLGSAGSATLNFDSSNSRRHDV